MFREGWQCSGKDVLEGMASVLGRTGRIPGVWAAFQEECGMERDIEGMGSILEGMGRVLAWLSGFWERWVVFWGRWAAL